MKANESPEAHRPLTRDFKRFWMGQTISQLGSSFTQFATPLLVFKLTHSAVNLGIATAATFVPYLLFGLIIGAWVDRLNRKRMMIIVDLGRAAVIGAIPIMAALGQLRVWEVYAVGFASSVLTIFFESGEFAAVPSLVGTDDLVAANGKIQASYSAGAVLGPLMAGLLLTVVAVQTLFLVDSASFVISSVALVMVRGSFNPSEPPERRSIRQDVAEGLRYVFGHPVLRNISAMMALFNFVGVTTYTQLVLFSKLRLSASDAEVGLLFSAGSIGVVVLGLAAGRLRRKLRFGPAALGALTLCGVLTILFSVNREYWVALPLWGLEQGLGIFFNINTISLRQALVPNHLLGRIVSIAGVLAWSAIPLGGLIGGYVIRSTGNVAAVFAAIGVIECVIAGVFFFLSPLGHAEDYLLGGDRYTPVERAAAAPRVSMERALRLEPAEFRRLGSFVDLVRSRRCRGGRSRTGRRPMW